MNKHREELRVLLMQIRHSEQVRREELQSFTEYAKLTPSQIDVLNVFDTPVFPETAAVGYDALFIGGASEASVLEPQNNPFLEYGYQVIRHSIVHNQPVFASCFGFQMVVKALGGEIVRDETDFETGTVAIDLTDNALEDPIMQRLPNPFWAVSVHRERAPYLPVECELLAQTKACPHAFKIKDKPVWAFQFHPEVDKKTLIERLTVYQEHYTSDKEQLQKVFDNAHETPDSNALVEYFIDYLVN